MVAAGDPQATSGAVLSVKASLGGQRWVRRLEADDPRPVEIEEATGCPPVLARLLAGRGVGPDQAGKVLQPSLRALMPDPFVLRGMQDAATLLADAVDAGASVGLFGDYDVDGAASCALMARWLKAQGVGVRVHIPDRIGEGYGPNIPAIDALASAEHGLPIDLLITLDCGATSHEALAHARSLGLNVLVLDHHQMRDLGPPVDALVNPNRPDDVSGLGYLCAAGVTFMALVAANRELRARGREVERLPDLLQLLDLVALATIADVVPLVGLNRAFVVKGLMVARSRGNAGLAALMDASRLTGPLAAYHFGFVLGPRINAGGRIGDAAMGARLLMSDDEDEARALAGELDTLNAQRQAIETQAVERAIARVEMADHVPAIIMLRDETWHQGVVGLIAARLKERFHRPSLAFTSGQDGHWTGSARSVAGIDIGRAVHGLVEAGHALKGGGHAMAAGLTLRDDQWQGALEALTISLARAVEDGAGRRCLTIDALLTAGGATMELVEAIEGLDPYGTDFPEPVFVFASHRVAHAAQVGTTHIKVTLADGDGGRLAAIAFRALETPLGKALLAARDGAPLHVAGTLSRNSWQGRDSAQLRIIDAARP
uniref:Single-stranded-DNA-specific exonuclease RecJ n=1 Tax=uncultured organism TaxID=155900 RepID=A0A068FQ22_9ZZZZ|nr:single-stranded-DNA-specific exonuclease [uncultured organism]